MRITRREILRAGVGAGLVAGLDGFLPLPGLRRLAFASQRLAAGGFSSSFTSAAAATGSI
jgi:hypothetical protein